jgi:3-dehydroquinate synthase
MSSSFGPGGYAPRADRWAPFTELVSGLAPGALAVVDARVAHLHPALISGLQARKPVATLLLPAGERTKSLRALGKILAVSGKLGRHGTLVAVGGGTVGDLCTVAAHLIKRGVCLIQVPTTVVAAVDSSVGGKGAINLAAGGRELKNAAGVFHYAREAWLCSELFETLEARQRREGAIEAWKMVACLDAALWRQYRRRRPGLVPLIQGARRLKDGVCRRDPYERVGSRRVLNFGHTFGHVLESLSHFRVSHGDAVGLGMLCALDVGRALGVTSPSLAAEVEAGLREGPGILERGSLAKVLRRASPGDIAELLASDKKAGPAGELRMVLLGALGRAEVRHVPARMWRARLTAWRAGTLP